MTHLKDTEPDAAENEPSPGWHEAHSELSSTPANDADCQPIASTDPPEDDVARNLPDEIRDQIPSRKSIVENVLQQDVRDEVYHGSDTVSLALIQSLCLRVHMSIKM